MRSINCYLKWISENGEFIKISNESCFAGIQQEISLPNSKRGIPFIKSRNISSNINMVELPYKHLAIYKFREKETEQYIELLIKTINVITPCEICKDSSNEEYIKFQILDTYDQSLILLNFIRNLWNITSANYCVDFFEQLKLEKSKQFLERLTHANIVASEKNSVAFQPGHSNMLSTQLVKIAKLKKTKELKAYMGRSTSEFLTS